MNSKCTFIKLLRKKDSDTVLYLTGIIVAFSILAVIGIINLISVITSVKLFHTCAFRAFLGIYCPGCGGTRAFIALMHGNVISSIIYHPFVIYAVIISLIFYISQTLRFITHGRVKGVHFRDYFVYIGIIILLGNFIIKNIFL